MNLNTALHELSNARACVRTMAYESMAELEKTLEALMFIMDTTNEEDVYVAAKNARNRLERVLEKLK